MHKVMARATYILGLVILAVPATASAQAPPYVEILSTAAGGSGCPGEEPRVAVSPDGERIYIINGALTAYTGPDVPLTEGRKFCQVTLQIDHSPGYSFAVSSEMGYRGVVSLDDDVTASLQVEKYFTGELSGEPLGWTFRGPIGRQYFSYSEPAMSPYSPCSGVSMLNIKTSVHVSKLQNPQGSGSIRVNPPWGIQTLRLHWRRC